MTKVDTVSPPACTVKRMDTGEQQEVKADKLAEELDGILHPRPEGN